ncbi:MAG: hypothetical protein ROR55_13410 [Devosia sp.]
MIPQMYGRRPAATWADFLNNAPFFGQTLFTDDFGDDDIEQFAPAPRALMYYSVFDGQVRNGGISQFFFNISHSMKAFEIVPDRIAEHPLFAAAVPLIREAYEYWAELKDRFEVARTNAGQAIASNDEDQVLEEGLSLFTEQREDTRDLDTKWFRHSAELNTAITVDVIRNPHVYLRIEEIAGLTGSGVEVVELDDPKGRWQLRFVDGFPVGPNLCEDASAPGGVRVSRFSPDRMHLEYDWTDAYMRSGEAKREWVDFRTGLSSVRSFKNGHLDYVYGRLHEASHGLSQFFDEGGKTTRTVVDINGESIYWRGRRPKHGETLDVKVFNLTGDLVAEHTFKDEETP